MCAKSHTSGDCSGDTWRVSCSSDSPSSSASVRARACSRVSAISLRSKTSTATPNSSPNDARFAGAYGVARAPPPARTAFLENPHGSLTVVLWKTGTLEPKSDARRPPHMNPRPASSRLRLALVVALAIGAAAGAGAYALTNHDSSTQKAAPLVVPAQPASSTSTVDSLTELYKQDAPGVVDITVQSTTDGSSGDFPFGTPGGS